MFSRLCVALDPSQPSARALGAGIELALKLDSALSTITIREPLPAYASFATLAGSGAMEMMEQDHENLYQSLTLDAVRQGEERGVRLNAFLLDGNAVDSIVNFISRERIDLLIVGLHRRSLRMRSLWSTVSRLARDLNCDMLGVH
jgi:nucleotide-binding universal stress UspA family protein